VREWWSTDKGHQAGTADNADTVDGALYTPHIPQNKSDRITADRSSSLPDDSPDNVSELHGDRTSGESDRHQGEREIPIGRHESEAS
jgi:hypothetical protein